MKNLFYSIRESLSQNKEFKLPQNLNLNFNPKISQVYITLFEEGRKPFRWGSKKETFRRNYKKSYIFKLKLNPQFHHFNIFK